MYTSVFPDDTDSILILQHIYSLILSVNTLSRKGVIRDSHCFFDVMYELIDIPVSSSIG